MCKKNFVSLRTLSVTFTCHLICLLKWIHQEIEITVTINLKFIHVTNKKNIAQGLLLQVDSVMRLLWNRKINSMSERLDSSNVP